MMSQLEDGGPPSFAKSCHFLCCCVAQACWTQIICLTEFKCLLNATRFTESVLQLQILGWSRSLPPSERADSSQGERGNLNVIKYFKGTPFSMQEVKMWRVEL